MSSSIIHEFLASIPQDVYKEVSLNIDIANKISRMLRQRHMTQRDLAVLMGKKESEISRWLTGTHGFNSNTLAKIESVLGEPVIYTEKSVMFNYIMPYAQAENNSFSESSTRNPILKDCFVYNHQQN